MDSPVHNYPSLSEVHQTVDTTSTQKTGLEKNTFFFWSCLSRQCWIYGSGQLGH